jgi:hypothetical protein
VLIHNTIKITLSSKWPQTENVKNHAAYNKTLIYYGSIQPKDTCLKGCDAVLLVNVADISKDKILCYFGSTEPEDVI